MILVTTRSQIFQSSVAGLSGNVGDVLPSGICRVPANDPVWDKARSIIIDQFVAAGESDPQSEAGELLDAIRARGYLPGCSGSQKDVGTIWTVQWRELACLARWYAGQTIPKRAEVRQELYIGAPWPYIGTCMLGNMGSSTVGGGDYPPPDQPGWPTPAPCVPRNCAQLGLPCGSGPDGCGGTVYCGECQSKPATPHVSPPSPPMLGSRPGFSASGRPSQGVSATPLPPETSHTALYVVGGVLGIAVVGGAIYLLVR